MSTTDIIEAWNGPGRRDGELTAVEPRHNALHPAASKLAFEHWYFDARLDTGHVVVGFLTKRRPEDLPGRIFPRSPRPPGPAGVRRA